MTEAMNTIKHWIAAGEPFALIAAGALVAACFVIFNAARVVFYVPQIATCWSDKHGCPTINLTTWCSWLIANASTGLYMWMFQGDVLGLCLNFGNALMCAVTLGVTLVKRKRHKQLPRPASNPSCTSDVGPHVANSASSPPAPGSPSPTWARARVRPDKDVDAVIPRQGRVQSAHAAS